MTEDNPSLEELRDYYDNTDLGDQMSDAEWDNETITPAQRHYAEAERLLRAASPDAPDARDAAILAAAQVHATLAQAASNEALLQFIGTHVTNTVLKVLKQYLGGTTYNVSVADEAAFARDVKRQQRWQGGV
ncbi:hypothetical protein SEA_SPOOKY_61 [Gordonia phage Spooky]|nr:hypothetical protein SEA_SPOOKY_61 [Gordonia phage Spooky]